ncbi:Papilin, partial [Eschrichtius robustus]|nr:Papilin [Eschrichtius robustus]
MAPRVRRQSDTWSSWGNWSPCSRTCGGGVSFRERPCYSQRRDGGSGCVGPSRSHRSCRPESCPDGARDFRAEQCAEFDGQEFQGRRYKWLPYYGGFKSWCDRDSLWSLPSPLVSAWQVVGCDHNLDSWKQEDKCLQCGGDGTTCYPVTGVFDANDLSRGYNQILIVPVGATSIRIEEAAASRNFLAVKSIRGEYYLNGHWTIEGARALPVASTVLHYERGAEGDLAPERLHARGPTSEPLIVELISQEPNPGVHFEYHLPLSTPRPGFSWSHGSWGDCSATCGGGDSIPLAVEAGPGANGQVSERGSIAHRYNSLSLSFLIQVRSMQDMHTTPRDPWMSLGPREAPASDFRDQWWAPQEQPSAQGNPRGDQSPHLPAPGPAPSLRHSSHRQPLQSGLAPRDCRHSPHGCCPDGHTASLGPQWQGCPGASCQQSRFGCCPDGVSVAEGPHQAGCASTYGRDNPGSRPRSREVASTAQQDEPSECRGSQFGCCYDNMASALGPLGEGCVGQPSYMYPVRCLLPSAHGSCMDWAARWYFIASVGQCNRFWYGGCHGNANNFASEEECVSSCRGPQHEPRRHDPGASGQSTHRDSGGSGPGGQQEASQHGTEPVVQRKPLPSGGLWWRDQEPGPGAMDHRQAFGEGPQGQELGPSAPGLGGDAGPPAPPSHSSSYRITLAGSEPSLVQVALGQLVRLFCPDDSSLDPHARWQKDGRPISSARHQLQPDGSLVISPLWAEDTGTYSCGSTRPDRDSQKIQLRITGGDVAVLPEAEPRHFPQTRDPAQGHSPWDRSLGGGSGGRGAVSSSHPRPTSRLRLDRHQPGVVDAHPGQRIRLTCRAEGFPPPSVEWQRDGQPLSSPRHQLQSDGSLVISRVAVEDGGFYTCVAVNGQDRDQRWVQLRVLGELTITGLPSTVMVPEGDTARLLCAVAGESVNIRWSRDTALTEVTSTSLFLSP